MLLSGEQIKRFLDSGEVKEAEGLFNSFRDGDGKLDKHTYCLMRDYLLIVTHLSTAQRSGVCANMEIKELYSAKLITVGVNLSY